MSKDCDDSLSWGTILSLTGNVLLSLITAGFAYRAVKSKGAEKHKINSHTILTHPDGSREERHVEAVITAKREKTDTSLSVNTGKAAPSSAVAPHLSESKDAEAGHLVGPSAPHLKEKAVVVAMRSAMQATDGDTLAIRQKGLLDLARVTANPARASVIASIKDAAEASRTMSTRAAEVEELDDGRGVAFPPSSERTRASSMADVALLAMAQQRGLVDAVATSAADGSEAVEVVVAGAPSHPPGTEH